MLRPSLPGRQLQAQWSARWFRARISQRCRRSELPVSDATAKKEERRKFQAIRGTRDLLPPETALWSRVEQGAHEVFGTFGYGEIRPPIFEQTDLFARAVGGETDIVSKEMYSFPDPPQTPNEFVQATIGRIGHEQFALLQSDPEKLRDFMQELTELQEATLASLRPEAT